MFHVPRTTFYRWYERYRLEGRDALKDKALRPETVWNRIPDDIWDQLITLALDRSELSPRELAVLPGERFTVISGSELRGFTKHHKLTVAEPGGGTGAPISPASVPTIDPGAASHTPLKLGGAPTSV